MKRCAYIECNKEIPENEVFCLRCKVEKAVIGVSDQSADCKEMGYKNFIGFLVAKNGFAIRPNWEEAEGVVKAAVSKGRWYAKCSDPDCLSNIPLDELTPKAFCIDCLNIKNDLKAYNVDWHGYKQIKEILSARGNRERKNYLPHAGETLQSLQKENEQYGWKLDYGILHT